MVYGFIELICMFCVIKLIIILSDCIREKVWEWIFMFFDEYSVWKIVYVIVL